MSQSVWSLSNRFNLKRGFKRTTVVLTCVIYIGFLVYWTSLSLQGLTLVGILVFLLGSLSTSTEKLTNRFRQPFHGYRVLDERRFSLRNCAHFWSHLLFGISIFFIWTASDSLGYLEPDPPVKENFPHTPKEAA